MKNPWLSATLNGLLPGLGYIYNGRRIEVGLLLFCYSLGALLVHKLEIGTVMGQLIRLQVTPAVIQSLLYALLVIAMAIDSYREAVLINSQGRRRRSPLSSVKNASTLTAARKTIKK